MTTPLIILGLLVAPSVLLTLLRRSSVDWQARGGAGLALVFGFTGVGHFLRTEPMAAMLPEWVPGRIPLIYATGVLELILAVMLVIPRVRRAAGWIAVLLLIAFLPVNIYAAVQRSGLGGHQWGPAYLLIRVPLQLILIGWSWWFAAQPANDAPVRIVCRATLPMPPEWIAEQILDLARWPEFEGYGPLPGIRMAEFEARTDDVVGTRIRVENTDGTRHVEEILTWQPTTCLRLRLADFSPPLSRIADHFIESWHFERTGDETRAVRSFELHARSALTRPLLVLIRPLLRRAIERHLSRIKTDQS